MSSGEQPSHAPDTAEWSLEDNGSDSGICEKCRAKDEYIRVLQAALQEVLQQNDLFRRRVFELEATIDQGHASLQEKDDLLTELSETLESLDLDTQHDGGDEP